MRFTILDDPGALWALTGPLALWAMVLLLRRHLTSIEVAGAGGWRMVARFRKH